MGHHPGAVRGAVVSAENETLELNGANLMLERYGDDVTIEYVERSCDHWHSDTSTTVDISETQAREIIAFLQRALES